WVVTSDGDSERSTSTSRPPPGTARSDVPSEPPAGSVPITVVKIDNVRSARPQTGLDIADVVRQPGVSGRGWIHPAGGRVLVGTARRRRTRAQCAGDRCRTAGPVREPLTGVLRSRARDRARAGRIGGPTRAAQ